MAKNITIAKLDINTGELIKSMSEAQKEIDKLQEKQAKLIDKGKEASKEFIINEGALRALSAAYKAQQAALDAQYNSEGKLLSQKTAIKQAVKEVNNTENDYIANTNELIRLKKELNSNDDNYEKRLGQINAKLQENSNWIRENGSANARLVTTMNDYKQQVTESFGSINILNGGFSGLVSRAQEVGGAGPLVSGALSGMTSGIIGMTKSAMGFIATPIGAILAALALVFSLVQNAMEISTESAGKITKIFDTFSVITDKLMGLLEPLGSFLIDGIAAGFELAGQAAEAAMGWIADGLSLLGFDDAANDVKEFTEDIKKTASETQNLKKAQENLAAQMAVQEVANEKAKQQIDELIQKSKDQSMSEEERLDSLVKAGKIEDKNFKERKKNADAAYDIAVRQAAKGKSLSEEEIAQLNEGGAAYAAKLMKVKGFTQQEIDALQKAQTERIRMDSEDKSRLQKQEADKQKILDDAAAKRAAAEQKRQQMEDERNRKAQKAIDDAIEKQKLELDLFIEQQGIKARSMKEELELAEKIAARKTAIAKAEFDASGKTANDKLQLDIANAEIRNGLAKAQMDVAVDNASRELEAFKAANGTKLEENKFLSAELYNNEVTRLDAIGAKELEYQQQRKAAGAISEQEYNEEIARINAANDEAKDALAAEREEADKTKKAIDLENKMAADTANMDYDLQFQLGKLEAQKAQELKNAEETGADTHAIKAKYAKLEEQTEAAVMNNKLDLASSTFGSMAAILGKESAAGKAMAVAQATIDTYKSAVSAYSSMSGIPIVGPALGAVAAAAAVAAGIANVKKITSTKAPKAEKGALFSIGGQRHSAGGTMFTGADGTQFEAEQGELIGVMNRNAARHFMAFNNAFPAGGAATPNYFAGGGIVSREIAPAGLDMDALAAKIADANRSIPAPVVAVQDIINEGNSYVKVREDANF